METLKKAALVTALMLLICSSAHAGDTEWDDLFAPYLQRIDKATTDSGDAQNVNTATHVITPWPPYVHNRRIPGDGARLSGAVERYHNSRILGPASPRPSRQAPAPSGAGTTGPGGQGNSMPAETSAQSDQSGQSER